MSGWHSKKLGATYRWTQPYTNWPRPTLTTQQAAYTLATLLVMAEIDKEVDSRLTYPEAESIIKNIANNSRGNSNA